MVSSQRRAAVKAAREIGWTDAEILRSVTRNVYGANRRKEIIVEWSEALGLQSSDALRIARNANLIPTAAPPRGPLKGKPPRKTPEKPS